MGCFAIGAKKKNERMNDSWKSRGHSRTLFVVTGEQNGDLGAKM